MKLENHEHHPYAAVVNKTLDKIRTVVMYGINHIRGFRPKKCKTCTILASDGYCSVLLKYRKHKNYGCAKHTSK